MDSNGKSRMVIWIMLVLSVAGFIDAVYLTIKTMIGSPITCYAFTGCDAVAQSSYSAILGVPLSLLGSVFYAATIILITYYLQRKTKRGFQYVVGIAIFGGLFALYLFALQAFVIKAWCFYCVVSDTIGVISMLLAIYLLKTNKA